MIRPPRFLINQDVFRRASRSSILAVASIVLALFAVSSFAPQRVAAAEADDAAFDLDAAEAEAFSKAIDRVAPSVVRIETIGSAATLQLEQAGTGPTTGLIVSSDGYVVTSSFTLGEEKRESMIVVFPDGRRAAAKIVAIDHNRKLALLHVESAAPLPTVEMAPQAEMRVGQWAIAFGRTFDGSTVNVSIGIISALDRIWDKAMQTDAKISPANYGGPLVDVRGRVLGVLAPLSLDEADAGVEWYDSGIGFAVPFEHVLNVLPKLKSGTDLHSGLMGVSFQSSDIFSQPASIGAVLPNSPAKKAGLQRGDRIVAVDGAVVERIAQLRHKVLSRYAGETIELTVVRDKQEIKLSLTLVDKLPPYAMPFLGLLPMRDEGASGVVVRYIYPESGAAAAGLQVADRITAIDGEKVARRDDLIAHIAQNSPGDAVTIAIERDGQKSELSVVLGEQPKSIPEPDVDARSAKPEPSADGDDKTNGKGSKIDVALPEFANKCYVRLPQNYDAKFAHGAMVWPQTEGRWKDDEAIAAWSDACDRFGLILLVVKSTERGRWERTELPAVARALDHVVKNYTIDPTRVVVHAERDGASIAWRMAFGAREVIRGAAIVDGPLPAGANPPETDPATPLSILSIVKKGNPLARRMEADMTRLGELKYPTTTLEWSSAGRYLTNEHIGQLARWIDALDRI